MKTCNECLEQKPLSDFYKKQSGKQGVGAVCRLCYGLKIKVTPKGAIKGSYKDYLKSAGMLDYYKRTARYW